MTVWETLLDQTKNVATTAAGTALDEYTKKLQASQGTGVVGPTTPPKTVGAASSKKWWIVGGLVALVAAGVVWFATRSKKK